MKDRMQLPQLQLLSSLPIDSLAALIGSIVCMSFSPIFIRLSEMEIGPNATAFNRFWIAAVAFGVLNQLFAPPLVEKDTLADEEKPILLQKAGLLIADGFLLSMGLIFWAWSLTQTSVANSSIIHNLIPIFTVLGGWLALGKNFDRRFLIGLLVAIAGATLLEIDDLFSFKISKQLNGDLAALLSAVFFGIRPSIVEQLRTQFNSIAIMSWSSTTSSLLVLPVSLVTEDRLFPSSVTGWCSVIALALLGQILGVGLWTYCLKKLASGFVSIVGLLTSALSAVEGWVFFSENLSLLTGVSFLVIVFGMYLAISSTSAIKLELEKESKSASQF